MGRGMKDEIESFFSEEVMIDNDNDDENDIRYDVHVPGDGRSDVGGEDADGAADKELSDDCLKTHILAADDCM